MTTNTTHPVFARIEQRYNETKPIRGWSTDVRPWGNRRRQNEIVRKINDDTYAARLYDTDVVVVHRDGRVRVDISYNSQMTNKFASLVLGDLRVSQRIFPAMREGRPWLYINYTYHPAWNAPVPLVLRGGTYEVDMTNRQYLRQVPDKDARKLLHAGAKAMTAAMRPVCMLAEDRFSGDTLLALWETPLPGGYNPDDYHPRDVFEMVGEHAENFTPTQLIAVALRLIVGFRRHYYDIESPTYWADAPERMRYMSASMLQGLKNDLLDKTTTYWRSEPITPEDLPGPHKRIQLELR